MLPNKFLKKISAIIVFTATCFLACRKELPQVNDPESGYSNTYGQVFDRFWNFMNSRYQHWDKDTTDWDAVYVRYKPLFDRLDIYNENDQRKSVQYFRDILAGNLDGHLAVEFYTPAMIDSFLYPRLDQNEKTINHIQRINPQLLPGEQQRLPNYYAFTYYDIDKSNYLDAGSISGIYNGPDFDVNLLQGAINGNIAYLGFDGEALTSALDDPGPNLFKSAYNSFAQTVKNTTSLKGVIVDMRGNTGGNGNDAKVMASAMIDKTISVGSARYKNGTGRLDFTPWSPIYINPTTGSKALKVPLIILTDVLTFSAGEYVTSFLHAIPGAIAVGTATRGGNIGALTTNIQGARDVTFKVDGIGNFMSIDLSAGAFKSPNGVEPIWGLKPDYEVPFDTVAIKAGRDPQLEKALSLIR